MNAAILCIGTELTRGEIHNTNATWLAERLTALGVEVIGIHVCDDERGRIVDAVQRAVANADLVLSTGGLGPTTDDITTASIAGALGVQLERHPPSLEAIARRMTRAGRTMTASSEKQADFPTGAVVLPNDWGTAPGFRVDVSGAHLFVFPGVPREMKPMFEAHVPAHVGRFRQGGIAQIRIKTFGLPESTVGDRLADVEAAHDVTLGYRAHFPEIEVKVLARGLSDDDARARARAAADVVIGRLGEIVYAEGERSFPEVVGDLLRERSLTIATAESCTGGLVGALLTDAAGSSDYFRGAVVAYANEVKVAALGVDPETLRAHGAVSEAVAREMAEGARARLGTHFALSLTGVAGPGGGTADKPVGLVHFAVATPTRTVTRSIVASGDRAMVRRRAAFAGLDLIRAIVTSAESTP